jgi:hypothetical protein
MKIKRNQVLLLLVVVIVGIWLYRRRYETYDVSQSKEALIEYIQGTTEPDAIFVMQSVGEMTKDKKLIDQIFEEADKGDLADKVKLTDLIKKI